MRLNTILLIFLLVLGTPSCTASSQIMIAPDSSIRVVPVSKKVGQVIPIPPMAPPIKVSSMDYKDYSEPINKIKKKFQREQASYSKTVPGSQYFFRIFPLTMFPFFCMKETDTVDQSKYRIIFSEGYETSIGAYVDRFSMDHVYIAVLQYVTLKSLPPYCRTYFLFSLRKNYATKEWETENKPIIISMYYNSKNGCYYVK